ncbi:MAG: hypothetical protein V1721_03560 [Pseudomonadota bacterium]
MATKHKLPEIQDDEIPADILNQALMQGAQSFPSLSSSKKPKKTEKAVATKRRKTMAISLPEYVWDWIRDKSFEEREPQNVIILKAMKDGGAPIQIDDLVDARKSRWLKAG